MAEVKELILITEPYPDGQRVTGVAIEYDETIVNELLRDEMYSVSGRTVCRVYANSVPDFSETGMDGNYVIIRLSEKDADCATLKRPEGPKPGSGGPGPGGPGGPGPKRSLNSKRKELSLSVSQNGEIQTVSGAKVSGFSERKTEREINLIVDEFKTLELKGMEYSLYIPEEYDSTKKYPLILFIPDATGGGTHVKIALEQGNGAINFAKERDQKKHPAFILVPQYSWEGPLTKDDFTTNSEAVEVIHDMIVKTMEEYTIDSDRVYATGQSMGCMTSCELNVRYPDLFAASLLVAGQWNPETMASLYRKNFWILVSEHDVKAFPGMTAVLDAMKAQGGIVEQYYWNAKADPEELNAAVLKAAKSSVNLRFTVFEGDSVVPEGEEIHPGSNHMSTWPVVYSIDALRDWLLEQVK